MTEYLEILNLQPVPQKYIDRILSTIEIFKKHITNRNGADDFLNCNNPLDKNPLGFNQREDILASLQHNNLQESDIALFYSYPFPLPTGLEDWVRNNIMSDGIAKVFIMANGNRFLPHTDRDREIVAYNYIITKGGNVKNKFWKPKSEYVNHKIFHTVYLPYERLEQVAEYEVDENSWYRFNPSSIHSVEDISNMRILLSIDSEQKQDPYLFKKKIDK